MSTPMWLGTIEEWPWDELLNRTQLSDWLGTWLDPESPAHEIWTGDGRTRVPSAITAMVRCLKELSLAHRWCEFITGYRPRFAPASLLEQSRDGLLDQGFRSEFVDAFLIALLTANLEATRGARFAVRPPLAELVMGLAKAMIGGHLGEPRSTTLEWLLEFAANVNAPDAPALLRTLREAHSGDATARKAIVDIALPYWHQLADDQTLSSWNEHPELLGFPYDFARESDSDPELQALRAKLSYVQGHAGDEDAAVRLAADAAFSGSATAWELLEAWRVAGDGRRVLRCLLSVGSMRLTGKDCYLSRKDYLMDE